MKCYWLWKQMWHIITIGLQRVNTASRKVSMTSNFKTTPNFNLTCENLATKYELRHGRTTLAFHVKLMQTSCHMRIICQLGLSWASLNCRTQQYANYPDEQRQPKLSSELRTWWHKHTPFCERLFWRRADRLWPTHTETRFRLSTKTFTVKLLWNGAILCVINFSDFNTTCRFHCPHLYSRFSYLCIHFTVSQRRVLQWNKINCRISSRLVQSNSGGDSDCCSELYELYALSLHRQPDSWLHSTSFLGCLTTAEGQGRCISCSHH
jgi:hypothetical protein